MGVSCGSMRRSKFAIFLLVLLVFSGVITYIYIYYARPQNPSLKPSIEKLGFSEGRGIFNGIPYLCYKPVNWNGKAIVFVHGLGRSKTIWTDDMKTFKNLGYLTISVDLPFHGERGNFQGVEQLPELVRRGSDEIVLIVDALRGDGASEVYIVARSLGSIVSSVALGKGAKVDKAELLLASANLRYVFKYGSSGETPTWIEDYKVLHDIDPLYFLPNYTGRIHFHLGLYDDVLTPEAGVYAYNAAILARERKIIWHNVSHSMPFSEYFSDAKDFFESEEFKLEVSGLVNSVSIPSTGGNGVCDEGESWSNSPFDCKEDILIIAFQLHIEEVVEGKYYDSDPALFNKYADTLDKLAALFEKHGAKISIQTEKNFAIGDVKYGRYLLKELLERGHGVGVQSHMGHHIGELNLKNDADKLEYTLKVKEYVSKAIEQQPTNLGGGFEMENINLLGYTKGGFTSMTAVEKPYSRSSGKSPYWLHPWILPPTQMINLKDPKWLVHDPSGNLVYIPGWYMNTGEFEIDCRKNIECFKYTTQSLYQALNDTDPRFINVWWFSSHLYQCGANNMEVEKVLKEYDRWLTQVVDPLVRQGRVKWMTFDEIANLYLKWEKERCIYISRYAQNTVNMEDNAGIQGFMSKIDYVTANLLTKSSERMILTITRIEEQDV